MQTFATLLQHKKCATRVYAAKAIEKFDDPQAIELLREYRQQYPND
ncbi:MAG: hypothetical protein MUF87_10130 [Anaerolineae bacterium]|nr:hypothetical protein [Anaerolineae bacterium]